MIDYKSKLFFIIYFFFSIIIGTFIGIFLVYYFVGINTETANNLKILSYFFIACATIIASIQLAINAKQTKYSNNWNKKQMAMIRLHESEKTIKEALKSLHKHLDVVGRDPEDPYQLYEIHNKMGVFLENGKFIYHGEQTKEDKSIIPKRILQKADHICSFDNSLKGRDIRDSIIALLNEYEYIALNVNLDIFDRNAVILLYSERILRTYKKFTKYIEHLRKDHKFGNDAYIEFENLAKSIIKS
ncbi:hypothetical protein AAX29_00575 [Aliarcobacter thereius]|uniref:DUF4760 domain-containing protein n=1 Tax=Aliarcobacter thereius TaxID=544718 RepID=A0A1C0B7H6_9BACT|nr:DUF4760 domain-containing protein [Aliarcobacter thereius]OCL99534.1 hypothetical protein AAX29_00575 [Aliarcobacter thereius]